MKASGIIPVCNAKTIYSQTKIAKVNVIPWLMLLLACVAVVLLNFPLTVCPLGIDQGVWSTVGLSINNGSVFFRDLLHFNLPGLGFSYAFALRLNSDPRVATVILNVAGSILMMLGMFFLLRQTVSAASGAWAVLFFSGWYSTMTHYWNLAQKDFMAMWGVLIATWLMARAVSGSRWRKPSIYLAGIFVGVATMYKPLFVISGPMLALIYIVRFVLPVGNLKVKTNRDWLNFLYEIALLVAGALTIAVPFFLYIARAGALENFYYGVFVFAPEYARDSLPMTRMFNFMRQATYKVGLLYSMKYDIYFWVWTIVLGLGFFSLVAKNYGNERYWLVVPCLTSIFTGVIQGKAYLYHALPWQMFLLAVAGCSFAFAWSLVNRSRFLVQLTCIALMSFILILWIRTIFVTSRFAHAELQVWLNKVSRKDYMEKFYKRTYGTFPNEIEILAQWIKENSLPTDKILAWGLECQLYSLSDRMHATHSPFNNMLIFDLSGNALASTWQKKIRHQFIQQLTNERPKFIIIVNGDNGPMPSNEAVAVIPGFQEMIDNQYYIAKSLGPYDIYELQSFTESNLSSN